MILQAFAANALSAARLIRAVAVDQVFFLVAVFHDCLRSIYISVDSKRRMGFRNPK